MKKYSIVFKSKTRVRYITNQRQAFEWICSYFQNYYECVVSSEKQEADFCVEYIVDKNIYDNINNFEDNNSTIIDGFLESKYVKNGNHYISVDKSHMIYKCNNMICIYAPKESLDVSLITMRIVRDIFSKNHENAGEFVLHSGTVELNGYGITFVGEKNAGKTTAVLTMLKYLKASFVSNDKTYIGSDCSDTIKVYGWPTTCSIALGSLNSFPELVNYMTANMLEYPQYIPDGKKPKIELTSNEISKMLNVNVVSCCNSNFIFFPHISEEVKKTQIKKCSVDGAQKVILNNILTPYDPHYPDFLEFRINDEKFYQMEAIKLAQKLAHSISCYEIFYGYDIKEMSDTLRNFVQSSL